MSLQMEKLEHNMAKITIEASAEEMAKAVKEHFEEQQIIIKTAAVADYRPKYVADEKIKKT